MAKRGRPTAYDEKYCEMLIEHMSQAYSFEAFAGKINVNIDTIYAWEKSHPEFSEAKKNGKAASLYHDEQILKGLIIGKIKGQINGQIYTMKCKYRDLGWKEADDLSDLIKEKIEIHVK